MRGFKTDKDGRWSPVYDLDSEDKTPLIMIAAMALVLFCAVFAQWWFGAN